MTAIRIPLQNHVGALELDAYEGTLQIDLVGTGDTSLDLSLFPTEARALAAVLVHQAGELEAGRA